MFAYACEPGHGSEPGAGWGLVRAVSRFADCVVLVGPEHIAGIRRWQASQGAQEYLKTVEYDRMPIRALPAQNNFIRNLARISQT